MTDDAGKLGQYTLLEKIAQGGMAQVFKAKTTDSNGFSRLVVIKRILPHISADPEYVEMLVDEAKIAVNFNHGNIAQIYDLGRVKDDYFIVMEYVDGKTFSQISKKLQHRSLTMPLDILLYCMIEVCRALSYIHNKKGVDGKNLGVVHRDVSPQNIILSYAGQIKIIDFGVAKAISKEGKTQSGVLKGKFAYMSPEQARSDTIDHRSDIFSLGILLWEMATGARLFKRKTNHETVQAIQKAKYEHATSLRSNLPREFDKIIKKALQRNPKHRFADAADMAHDLEKLLIQVNPEFKPVYAAEFIYKLFGPESDEAELPDQIFVQEKTPVTRVMNEPSQRVVVSAEDVEEPTIRESDSSGDAFFSEEVTPVVRIRQESWYLNHYIWLMSFFVFLFFCGAAYVFIINKFAKGYIEFIGLDSHSVVFINDKELDDPPDTLTIESEKNYKILVRKSGYEDFVATVLVKPSATKRLQIKLKKLPPPVGNLLIKTNPPGATIYLDNVELKDKTPVVVPKLIGDQLYSIGLFLPNHRFYKTNIKMAAGEDMVLEHAFVSNVAEIQINSEPSGAEVWIDDQKLGHTPYQSKSLLAGEDHQIHLKLNGYNSEKIEVQLRPGESKTYSVDLKIFDEDRAHTEK